VNIQHDGPRHSSNKPASWRRYTNRLIATELSAVTRYYDRVIQCVPRDNDTGLLLASLDCKERMRLETPELPDLHAESEQRTAILINGAFNHHFDIQGLLTRIKSGLSRTSRILLVLYNPYLRWLYALANRLGVRKGELPSTFITRADLENLSKLSGFEVLRHKACVYFPWRLLGLGDLINRICGVIPVLRWMALTDLVTMRPVIASAPDGLSCVIPARNERGNIENALKRFPDLGCKVEIIFVEGHSTDGTWEEIERVAQVYKNRFEIKTLKQTGKGKADAVRLGFANATQQLLTILDADLTMPPEMLSRFYEAYSRGYADFVNGSRLTYPMEGEAMRFLNRLGNIFFAKALSAVLGTRLSDSLCGTKLLTRHDYRRMTEWRHDFGEFDPFGDFELLFPAAVLGLGIIDVPVRYMARQYGSTNISRFRNGFQLLRMTLIGCWKISLSLGRNRAPDRNRQ
jgi:hypothetical protein